MKNTRLKITNFYVGLNTFLWVCVLLCSYSSCGYAQTERVELIDYLGPNIELKNQTVYLSDYQNKKYKDLKVSQVDIHLLYHKTSEKSKKRLKSCTYYNKDGFISKRINYVQIESRWFYKTKIIRKEYNYQKNQFTEIEFHSKSNNKDTAVVIDNFFDEKGRRIKSVEYNKRLGSVWTTKWIYNDLGNVLKMEFVTNAPEHKMREVQMLYAYDDSGNVVSEIQEGYPFSERKFSYDEKNRRVNIVGSGYNIEIEYANNGFIKKIGFSPDGVWDREEFAKDHFILDLCASGYCSFLYMENDMVKERAYDCFSNVLPQMSKRPNVISYTYAQNGLIETKSEVKVLQGINDRIYPSYSYLYNYKY